MENTTNTLVTPDFSDVQDEIAEGTYKCTIKKGEVKTWDSGDKYVRWELETYGEAEPKNNGRRIFDTTPVSGKGAFKLARFYRAAMGQSLTGSFDTNQLAGRKVEVSVRINQKGYPEIQSVRPVTM